MILRTLIGTQNAPHSISSRNACKIHRMESHTHAYSMTKPLARDFSWPQREVDTRKFANLRRRP